MRYFFVRTAPEPVAILLAGVISNRLTSVKILITHPKDSEILEPAWDRVRQMTGSQYKQSYFSETEIRAILRVLQYNNYEQQALTIASWFNEEMNKHLTVETFGRLGT